MEGSFVAQLRDGGDEIGFYSEKEPINVGVNGELSDWNYEADQALLTVQAVQAKTGNPIFIKIVV